MLAQQSRIASANMGWGASRTAVSISSFAAGQACLDGWSAPSFLRPLVKSRSRKEPAISTLYRRRRAPTRFATYCSCVDFLTPSSVPLLLDPQYCGLVPCQVSFLRLPGLLELHQTSETAALALRCLCRQRRVYRRLGFLFYFPALVRGQPGLDHVWPTPAPPVRRYPHCRSRLAGGGGGCFRASLRPRKSCWPLS